MTERPSYTFSVSEARCARCSRPPAHVAEEVPAGRLTLLCKDHLEPWLGERRWAVLRMAYPYATEAEAERLLPEVVRVIYTEKENRA